MRHEETQRDPGQPVDRGVSREVSEPAAAVPPQANAVEPPVGAGPFVGPPEERPLSGPDDRRGEHADTAYETSDVDGARLDDVDGARVDGTPVAGAPVGPAGGEHTATMLFGDHDVERFRARWRELQADFVDDPEQAVRGADRLLGDALAALADTIARRQQDLRSQWQGAGETEALRQAIHRYRSCFDQLLNV